MWFSKKGGSGMSNLWLNIRFGTWHLQWRFNDWRPRLVYNKRHEGSKFKVEVYDFRRPF